MASQACWRFRGQAGRYTGAECWCFRTTGFRKSVDILKTRVLLRSSLHQPEDQTGISNRSYLAPSSSQPLRLISLDSCPGQRASELDPAGQNFDGTRPPRVVGYNIYRSEDPPLPGTTEQRAGSWGGVRDRNFQFGKTYHYAVSVVARLDPYAESARSKPVSIVRDARRKPAADAVVESGVK